MGGVTDPRNHLCHCGAWGSFGAAGEWLCFAHWSMTPDGQARLYENMEAACA